MRLPSPVCVNEEMVNAPLAAVPLASVLAAVQSDALCSAIVVTSEVAVPLICGVVSLVVAPALGEVIAQVIVGLKDVAVTEADGDGVGDTMPMASRVSSAINVGAQFESSADNATIEVPETANRAKLGIQ